MPLNLMYSSLVTTGFTTAAITAASITLCVTEWHDHGHFGRPGSGGCLRSVVLRA